MAIILATANLPYFTGLPRDTVQNTFTFRSDFDPGDIGFEADIQTISDALVIFYNVDQTNGHKLSEYLSEVISRETNACYLTMATVDITTGDVSPTFATLPFTLDAAEGTYSLPLEVALCNTIESINNLSNVPRARRRGRQYLGPWGSNAQDTSTSRALPGPTNLVVETIAQAAAGLQAAADSAGPNWCVWSRAGQDTFDVNAGWVDDAWDTQRRREVPATQRLSWTASF
jgi:hypothetical protein